MSPTSLSGLPRNGSAVLVWQQPVPLIPQRGAPRAEAPGPDPSSPCCGGRRHSPCAAHHDLPRLCPRAPILPSPCGGGRRPRPQCTRHTMRVGVLASPALRWTNDDDRPRVDSLLEVVSKEPLAAFSPRSARSMCSSSRHKTWANALLSSCLADDDYVLNSFTSLRHRLRADVPWW